MSDHPRPPKLRVAADLGKKTATVTLFDDGGAASATRVLDLTDLDGIIATLGSARADLVADSPNRPIQEGEQAEIISNVSWYTQSLADEGMSALLFRHPAFGLLGFTIPYAQAALLISLLAQQMRGYLDPTIAAPSAEPTMTNE